jgi:hypothetical protein
MRFVRCAARAIGLLALSAVGSALDAQTALQTVTFQIVGLRRAAIETMAAPLAVDPTSASVGTGSLLLASNEANQKVTASLDRAMPLGMALSIAVGPCSGEASRAAVLVTEPTDLVTRLPAATAEAMPLTYSMSSAHGRGQANGVQRVVTYTIVVAP